MDYAGLSLGLWFVLIVLVVLGIVGVIGNAVTIVFYAKQGADTSTTVFIIALSAVDLFLSSIVIMVDIYGVLSGFNHKNTIACKATNYLMKTMFIASFLLLLCVAVDRFRKICQPLSKQLTKAHSRLMTSAAGIIGLVLSSPIAFTSELQTITNSTAYSCTYDLTDQNATCQCRQSETGVLGTVYWVSMYIDVVTFIFILGSIIITYTCVLVKIRRVFLTKQRRTCELRPSDSQTTNNSNGGQRKTHTEQTLTVMGCCITLTFIACLIPYFIVEVGGFRHKPDDYADNVWMEILYRSTYLSCAINPYIACFFNPRFRQLASEMLTRPNR